MRIGIMDADLIYRRRHRFPNLVCMKLAGYHKQIGNEVVLHTREDVSPADGYDFLYVAKVFTDTPLDINWVVESLKNTKVIYNGTGFFFDNAIPLPREIEHTMPDYHLYDNWLKGKVGGKGNDNIAKWYQDYSIGFLTRGCFRHCPFCVNQRFNKVEKASPLMETK
nr:MAG TPA: Radical SAM superfamily [Caudoviricetes sp.]